MGKGQCCAIAVIILVPLCFGIIFGESSAPALATGTSWSQDNHDAEHTGATNDQPAEPWTYLWTFNAADASGGTASHFYNAPPDARTVAGGGQIYVPAGSNGLYALTEATGAVGWHATSPSVSFDAAPAYDPASGNVLAGGSDGRLYEYSAPTGALVGTYNAGSPIRHAVMLNGGYAYVVTDDGHLDKVAVAGMALAWRYSGGDYGATSPAYSTSRNVVIFGTEDRSGVNGVHVHAVHDSTGTASWVAQPTTLQPAFAGTDWRGYPVYYNVWDHGWPVVAEQHGLVLMRLALNGSLGVADVAGPGGLVSGWPAGSTASTGSVTQSWLSNNPTLQSVYALSLDNGASAFIPAMGNTTTEDYLSNGTPFGVMGPMPVVKVWPNGDEVAYTTFRTGDCSPPDYRWTGHTGEMVLDGTTISGLVAGQFRFIAADHQCYPNGPYDYSSIVDEGSPLTMAGSSLFYSHWSASSGYDITNRGPNLGLTNGTPITVTWHPLIAHYAMQCSGVAASTHLCSSGGNSTLGRWYSKGGFTDYWSGSAPPPYMYDPPGNGTADNTTFSAGFTPRYVYLSDGYLVFEDNGGGLMVLTTTASPQATPTANPQYTSKISPILK